MRWSELTNQTHLSGKDVYHNIMIAGQTVLFRGLQLADLVREISNLIDGNLDTNPRRWK